MKTYNHEKGSISDITVANLLTLVTDYINEHEGCVDGCDHAGWLLQRLLEPDVDLNPQSSVHTVNKTSEETHVYVLSRTRVIKKRGKPLDLSLTVVGAFHSREKALEIRDYVKQGDVKMPNVTYTYNLSKTSLR
jgi:hypothetical protein